MRYFLFVFICLLFNTAKAQQQDSITYKAVIHFNSVCCGVPDSKPLTKAIKSFKKTHRIKSIRAITIGPIGKEGEYLLAFPLKGMSKSKQIALIKQMKTATSKMTDKGNAVLEDNETIVKSALPARVIFMVVYF